jgi:DNA polymerase I
MTTLLIDADGYAFKAAAGVQKSFTWDGDNAVPHANLEDAQDVFLATIATISRHAGADEVVLCWSCPTRRYFRHDIFPAYKGNRKGGERPIVLADLRAWAEGRYRSYVKPSLEADDILGILATHPKIIPGRKIIASMDKDLTQIAGEHLSSDGEVTWVTPDEAKRFLALQILMGDASDGYPGIPGIGPKKAAKILSGVPEGESALPVIRAAYEAAGLTTDDMAVQVNVARILQARHYDITNRRPILWRN